MEKRIQINRMKTFGKLKWLLMAILLWGGTAHAHVYWDFNHAPDNTGDGSINHPVRDLSRALALLAQQDEDQWIIILSTIETDFNWGMNGAMAGGRIAKVKRADDMKGPLIHILAGTFTVSNVIVSGGFEGEGPFTDKEDYESLIVLDTCTTLKIKSGAVLRDNYMGSSSSRLGGAVKGIDATVIMDGGLITNCRTMLRGGGIYLTSLLKPCSFTMNDGEVSYCKTKDYGGGIFVSGKTDIQSSVTLNKGDIHNCVAYDDVFRADNGRGGGVCFFYSEVHFQGDEVLIHDNLAKRYGGGVRMNYSDVTFSAGKVYNNVASEGIDGLVPGSGGMALVTCLFSMSGGEIYNNVSGVGGGIGIAHEGVLEITGGKIYNNIGFCQGGGINLNTGTSLTMPVGSTLEMYGNISSRGGAILADAGTLTIYDGLYHDNIAADTLTLYDDTEDKVLNNLGKGGAFCIVMENDGTGFAPANFYVYGGSIYNNTASVSGGALYMLKNTAFLALENPKIVIKGGEIYNNSATTGDGGAMYADEGTTFTMTADTIMEGGTISEIHTGNIHNNSAGQSGGGIYITDALFTMSAGKFENNSAGQMGGGFCVVGDDSEVTVEGGEIKNNTASVKGGGFAVVGGDVIISQADTGYLTSISSNLAPQGGGLYVSDGSVTVSDATISGNTSTTGHGGAFDIVNGDLTVNNSSITGNNAPNGHGGGAYVGNGNVIFNAGTSVTYNSAVNGGGLFVGGGSITYNNGEIKHNTATGNGGGIYANADVEFKGGLVSENTARNGGGLYASVGTVDFSSGTFSQNSASGNGGGIYVKQGAIVQLSGNAVITKNHVPFAVNEEVGHGGGVYLAGQMKVGRYATDAPGTHTLLVQDNYRGAETMLNNIYLPTNDNVIELLSDLRGSTDTKIGFSVNNGYRKVVYHNNDGTTSTASWLHDLLGGTQGLTGVIFDDRQKYMAIHVLNPLDETFDHNYIYLWGCWISAVDIDPMTIDPVTNLPVYPLPSGTTAHYTVDGDGTWHIYTKEGLAWFSSYVNGLNDCQTDYDEDVNAAANAVMEADVDMSEFLWVPLGSAQSFTASSTSPTGSIFEDGHHFKGSFDGQGHVISGLDCRYINKLHNYGLFGNVVDDADIRNTFVDNYLFSSNEETDLSGAYYMGGIAGIASGNAVISNCEARGHMLSPNSTISVLGGIVGKLQDNATVHSSVGLPEFDGVTTTMGGIAGQTAAGSSVKNCYSNLKIGTVTNNVGGIVGANSGAVANCYVRLQHDTAPAKFYWFAATNSGTVACCYARNDAASNRYTTGTAPTGSGTYGATALVDGKYGYMQQDQQVAATNDYVENGAFNKAKGLTGLLLTLNNWVKAQPSDNGYATWTRTMASSINDDYPVHAFGDFSNAASRDGMYVEYKKDVNTTVDRFNAYSGGGEVYLYKSDTLKSSTNGNVRIHFGEDVGVFAESESIVTNARVGVTFDNSDGGDLGGLPYDWHMFSTPLEDAPLGITYNDMSTHQYGYVIPESAITLNADGYFPSNTPFRSFDYYCYSERDYHWINFKRSSNDHWQQNEPHGQIHYNDINNQGTAGNETTLIPGKGYMMAVDKETMLMADGRLANGDVTYKTTSSDLYGYEAPLKGVNLIGNPYQSYLNFDEFVNGNADKVYGNTYYILDADSSKYLAYTAGSTDNGIGAPGYLHPHQGFFVRVESNQTLEFTNAMRSVEGNADSHFRGEYPAYPLVNMICTDATGMMDYTTIELNRPEQGGGQKIDGLRTGNASLWFHIDDEDWQTAFTREGLQEAPLRFKAHADGTYTMRWSTLNGDFSYLHLVDNKTGTDTDCLLTEEYRFTATTHDYLSRFTLVFECTGVEENGPSTGSESFAFMMGDELVVNGEGMLQVYDMSGRLLVERELHGTQSTVSMPRVSNGMYLLRLRSASQVRVQKMVINK